MFNPDPKKGQYTPSDQDLYAEAMLMVGAGTDTTAGTLTVGTWHAMKNPSIATRLRSELQEAFPSKGNETEISRLESLPYLVCHVTPLSDRRVANSDGSGSKRSSRRV